MNVNAALSAPSWEEVVPVLERVCWECHDDTVQEGEIDLFRFETEAGAMAEYPLWQKVHQMVANREMPPVDEKTQPTDEERTLLNGWIDAALDRVARADAGDPGMVTLRRLTNTEFDNTIRDLTGLDLQLSRRFAKTAAVVRDLQTQEIPCLSALNSLRNIFKRRAR